MPTKGRPFSVSKISFKLRVSPLFTSESQNSADFWWDYNILSVTRNSSAYTINNNSNLNLFSIQQRLTISTSSSPKLRTHTSVKTEMGTLTITLRITETRPNKSQCEQKSPFWMHSYSFPPGKAFVNYCPHGYLRHRCC